MKEPIGDVSLEVRDEVSNLLSGTILKSPQRIKQPWRNFSSFFISLDRNLIWLVLGVYILTMVYLVFSRVQSSARYLPSSSIMLLWSVKLRELLIAIMTPFFLLGSEALKIWVNWRLVQWGSADFLKWVSLFSTWRIF